ncbi:MAG: substrate-binding periplasmic protein [Pseudomonadales bacterium]
MAVFKKLWPLLLCCAAFAQAQQITVGLHISPPWAYTDQRGEVAGIHRDIIARSFAGTGFEPVFKLYGYSRLLSEFKAGKVDFASPMTREMPGVVQSLKYLPFHTSVMALQNRQLKIEKVADLAGLRVIAFQQATNVLGDEFSQLMAAQRDKYTEFFERERQLRMLFKRRADVVIGERRILSTLAKVLQPEQPVQAFPIFPITVYPGGSSNKSVIEAFDRGVRELMRSGEYHRLLNSSQLQLEPSHP